VPGDGAGAGDPRIWVRIAADLRARITGGTYPPGQPVPSIKYLSQQWGTDRHTAGKALQLLESEGLLRRYPGPAGYRVTRPPGLPGQRCGPRGAQAGGRK
jgi:DNA-binding GntR family transcriptional regulator